MLVSVVGKPMNRTGLRTSARHTAEARGKMQRSDLLAEIEQIGTKRCNLGKDGGDRRTGEPEIEPENQDRIEDDVEGKAAHQRPHAKAGIAF